MTLDDLLALPGPLVPAWDLRSREALTLCMYRVGDGGAVLLGSTDIVAKEREPTNERLRDGGLRLGNAHSGYVWIIDDAGFTLWSDKARLADGTRDELRLVAAAVRTSAVTRVETFVDDADLGHRGVRVIADQRAVVVAEERSSTPELDPTYDAMELDNELAWATFLGRDLALWLRLPYADYRGDVTNAPQLAIHTAACALADQVARIPERGAFEFVFQSIGSIDGSGEAVLRLAANPLEDELRFVELRVHTPSGKSWMGRWIKQGTNPQIAAFLRNVRTPARIMLDTRELRRKLIEDEYE